ncbi:hypothetical protein VITU102760_03040 [Vibrio tubiashii]|uniref:Integrin n=1 Tax=Vibrio tubiashii ATCC 19109 TaxID=1051646 RepID=F9T325_9VIBR|nr:hypothetical protein [Vibrio tubiashii]AIW16910.1 integrin [Vibrio tubiashii ATCC 19109]EGU57248.1 Integrin alpha beta-propellor repeat protein [Vibrio tubiashii ATCC 19109]EIF03639.1 Integrin alpha beta-propellor repeat-containing protein [Vibrio tubiashii NCIMB 1337 = ATCC 19106]
MTVKKLLPVCLALGLSACGSGSDSGSYSLPQADLSSQSLAVTQASPKSGDVVLEWNKLNGASYYKLLRYRATNQYLNSEVVATNIKGTSVNIELDLVDIDGMTAQYELLGCRDNGVCPIQTPRFELQNLDQYVTKLKTHVVHGNETNVPHFGQALTWLDGHLLVNSGEDLADIYKQQDSGQYVYTHQFNVGANFGYGTGSILADITDQSGGIIYAGTRRFSSGDTTELHVGLISPQGHKMPDRTLADNNGFASAIAISEYNGEMVIYGSPQHDGSGKVEYMKVGGSTLKGEIQKPSDLSHDARFGASVSVANDEVLVVGAPMDSVRKQSSSEIKHSGAVYIYRRASNPKNADDLWRLDATLTLPGVSAVEGSGFGEIVKLNSSGDLLAVGAPGIDEVLIYRYDSQRGYWYQNAVDTIDPVKSSKGQRFGSRIALSDDGYLAVTAENAPWRGFGLHTNADTLELGGDGDGAVYIYHLTNYGDRDRAYEGVITGDSVPGVDEAFGESLEFKPGSHKLAIGAPMHPSDPLLDWSDSSWPEAGAVYVI